jgi:hypothetical protein
MKEMWNIKLKDSKSKIYILDAKDFDFWALLIAIFYFHYTFYFHNFHHSETVMILSVRKNSQNRTILSNQKNKDCKSND